MESIRKWLKLIDFDKIKSIEDLSGTVTGWMDRIAFYLVFSATIITAIIFLCIVLSKVIRKIGEIEKLNISDKRKTTYTLLLTLFPIAEIGASVYALLFVMVNMDVMVIQWIPHIF